MNYISIGIGALTLAACTIFLFDEFCTWLDRRSSRRATSVDCRDSARPDTTACSVFGAEFDPEFEWPERRSNVYPIHARRSRAHPYLRAVPDPTDAA